MTVTNEIEKHENSSTSQVGTISDLQSTSLGTNKRAAQTEICQQKNFLSQSSNHPPLTQEQTPDLTRKFTRKFKFIEKFDDYAKGRMTV